MATIDRRKFFRVSGAAAGVAAASTAAGVAAAREVPACNEAAALLYDATRCIGCRACMTACRKANKLPPTPVSIKGVKFDLPHKLSEHNWMVIQAYRGPAGKDGDRPWSFAAKACMHCNLPACATACPVAALKKTPQGPVTYEASRCIGCRYCQLACPYEVPTYEWVERAPRVRKCKLCMACVDACPTGALTQGTRKKLIEEAHRRIQAEPKRYVHHVYGEHEAGGASRLLLTSVPLEYCGFPKLARMPRSRYADAVMGSLPGWIIGMGLFLGGAHQLMHRQQTKADEEAAAKEQLE